MPHSFIVFFQALCPFKGNDEIRRSNIETVSLKTRDQEYKTSHITNLSEPPFFPYENAINNWLLQNFNKPVYVGHVVLNSVIFPTGKKQGNERL